MYIHIMCIHNIYIYICIHTCTYTLSYAGGASQNPVHVTIVLLPSVAETLTEAQVQIGQVCLSTPATAVLSPP